MIQAENDPQKYSDVVELKNVYLEDSFILGIDQTDTALRFTVEFVL